MGRHLLRRTDDGRHDRQISAPQLHIAVRWSEQQGPGLPHEGIKFPTLDWVKRFCKSGDFGLAKYT